MFGFFGRSGNNKFWLGNDVRLFTMMLSNVKDPFNPHPLWDSRHGGGRDIVHELENKEVTAYRLRDALDCHRCTVRSRNARGWLSDDLKVFSDVAVWISAGSWNRDIQIGGVRIEVLADNLSRLHKEDFPDELVSDRLPSYVVMPDASLEPDQVVFHFGLGVFVPGEQDRVAGRIGLKMTGQDRWHFLPDWIFLENGKRVIKPCGLYERQQYMVIGPQTPVRPPESAWFNHAKGAVFINQGFEGSKYAFGDESFVSDAETVLQGSQEKVVEFRFRDLSHAPEHADDTGQIMMLKIESELPDGTDKAEHEQPDRFPEQCLTIIPGAEHTGTGGLTIIPGCAENQLVLEGIALPRIDTPGGKVFERPGFNPLLAWTLWFDKSGRLVNTGFDNPDEASKFTAFSASSSQPFLSFRNPGQSGFSKIETLPFTVESEQGCSFEIVPSPLNDLFHGILVLPGHSCFPVEQRLMIIGRFSSGNGPDIPLQFLIHPKTLKWQNKTQRPVFMGDIGMSRQHVKIELKQGCLEVVKGKNVAPVYILNRDMSLKQTFSFEENAKAVMNPDEYLVVGYHVLRFM